MLSKAASSTIFWVFGMTWPGIEPQSAGPLAKTELFDIELFWHLNCVLMQNWIVWNRTGYMDKSV